MTSIRHRGIKVIIDTTEVAELEIAGYQITDADLDLITKNLTQSTFSPRDRVVGPVRIRLLKGYDVMFLVGREGANVVITIGSIRPPDPNEPTEDALKRLGILATLRGASGI
ncbi:hypothetical protein MWU60_01780 [Yoonia sp. F2084L]|uniref:hypothetical protein n=1 Tax=Yoonia sp. F2084L TaxID=2926419 RepID=UPI001FF51515|nr:hypothetical protein [Yoonia sp. F2084L]MCK0094286.1 hypothetical protein [Yoonia sp. F2084L]